LRIGVLSDTHGNFRRMRPFIEAMEGVDFILHAGDYYEDAKALAKATGIKVIGVTGNCDYLVRGPSEEMLSVLGKKVFLTHGHIYRVKQDYSFIIQRSKSLGVDVTVFGHTHYPAIFEKDGILFVNPGTTHSHRKGHKASCAILDVSRSGVKASLITENTLKRR
jgi:putative phosphoesterase